MKLYYSKGACSFAVRIVIHEIGLDCEFESVNLTTKQTETGADFLTVNPKGSVPTLALNDGTILTENAIIQQYLADTHQATELLPGIEDFQRYRVLEWLNFTATDLHKGFSPLFNAKIPQEQKNEIFLPALEKKFQQVEKQLANHQYIMGEQFTLPDAYLFTVLRWFKHFANELSQWPHIERYMAAVSARPAVQQSLQEESLSV